MTREFILDLLGKIKKAKLGKDSELPGNSCFLDDDMILCGERECGESRYPYGEDGLVVWLRSTGFIDACESTFNIFRTANFGEESAVSFFGGIRRDDGDFFPVSVTGAARQLFEDGVSRYIVYSLRCAYCVAETEDTVFVLRLSVGRNKHIHFTLGAVDKSGSEREIYLAYFMEAMLRHAEYEKFWARLSKFGKYTGGGSFVLKSVNSTPDMLVINRRISGCSASAEYHTTARSAFLGIKGMATANAVSLRKGKIERECNNTTTTDLPAACELVRYTLPAFGEVYEDIDLAVCHSEEAAERLLSEEIDPELIEAEIASSEKKEKSDYDALSVSFDNWKSGKINAATFGRFLRCIRKQTSFCAHGKNYAGAYLGIRDVFQQLEGALMWQRELSREKMLLAMNYILSNGRPPRMFSIPNGENDPIPVDLEKYIDQGVWIISTFYTYLSFTGDFSVLDEECGYIDAPDEPWCDAHPTGERDTVLGHLIRITDFLISNIDTEYTGCLKVLFGDWNDAVDGLGHTDDEGKEFGTGVTVMATLQFRQNLFEMSEILRAVGGYDEQIEKYRDVVSDIERGLEKNAVEFSSDGRTRIVHGWGDKVSYKVGSFCDPDGASRHSLTPNAFWAITGFIKRDPSLKNAIMECMDSVSSKYGLKTFDVPFPSDARGVGRITNIVPGTYENSCAYAHGSLFGTMAMFALGESRRAWEEIEKTVVITHRNATMTSFVMPNSYCENTEYGMDGESLGDWHTGSGCVLIKEIVKYGFGIQPTLDGLYVKFPAFFPAEKGEMKLRIRECDVTVSYADKGEGIRNIVIEGASYTSSDDRLSDTECFFIPAHSLGKELRITVTD